nr:MAG TPA: hypothetical protein [Caudoviricetes sp.]
MNYEKESKKISTRRQIVYKVLRLNIIFKGRFIFYIPPFYN